MADVGEEGRLGPVELGQRLGAPPLVLVGTGIGDGGGHGRGQQVVEAAVGLVHRHARVDAGNQDGGRAVGARREDRQGQGGGRWGELGADAHLREPVPDTLHVDGRSRADNVFERPDSVRVCAARRAQAGDRVCIQAGRTDQPGITAVGVERVEQDERQVERVLGQSLSRRGEHVGDGFGLAGLGGQVTQRPCPALGEHLSRHLDDGVEQAADLPGLVPDRAEREREEALLEVPVPVQEDVLSLQERLVACQGGVVRLANDRPRFRPARGEVLPHRARMLVAADDPVRVVVELHETRPPDDADGQVRGQADADGRAQTLWPLRHRAQRAG